MRGSDHGLCLTEETLTEYLEGALDPALKAASEVHLVACTGCRTQLGFFMRILEQEVKSEEAATLQVITAEWDKKKSGTGMPRRTGTFPGLLLACAGIAAALVFAVVSAWFINGRLAEPKSASDIVQLLLARNRPFESRLANEAHLPIVRTRGTEETGVSYGLLAGELTRLSANSHEMGRFYLLQKDFERAIPYLEIAEREVGATAAVHNDLGVAYLEAGNAAKADMAAKEFQHALEADPSFAPAAFNLAVFYERTNETLQAAAQWKRYLELDPKSEWGGEARERLQGLSR